MQNLNSIYRNLVEKLESKKDYYPEEYLCVYCCKWFKL